MMKIIDAHVHMGRYHLTLDRVGWILEKSGIDEAVIFADPESPDIPGDNNYCVQIAESTGKYYPYFYIGGNAYSYDRPYPEIYLPENFDQFKGIKWHCWLTPGHDVGGIRYDKEAVRQEMDSKAFEDVVQELVRRDVPVNFEEHFEITVEFVERYPDLNVIIPHMGALNGGQARIVEEFKDTPNVHFDTSLSWITPGLVDKLGADRLISGSDYPYGSPGTNKNKIQSLDISDEEKELIFNKNILRLMKVV